MDQAKNKSSCIGKIFIILIVIYSDVLDDRRGVLDSVLASLRSGKI